MGEAIITRRGGSGEVIVEFDNFIPSDLSDKELIRSTPTALSVARYALAGASIGDYALFAGGDDGSDYCDTVDAYDTSLTRSTVELLEARIAVQEAKLVAVGNASIEAKLKFEELSELVAEMQKTEVDQKEIQKVIDRAEEHKQANIKNYREYEQLKVKLEENKEMLKILKGEDSIDR